MFLTYDLTVEIRRQCWVLVCQTLDFQISAQEGIFKIDVLKKGPITRTQKQFTRLRKTAQKCYEQYIKSVFVSFEPLTSSYVLILIANVKA